MSKANYHTMPLPSKTNIQRYEWLNLGLIYVNSLVFSGLFSAPSLQAYLVQAVFNGSGIIMVVGLLSLIAGFVSAQISQPKAVAQWGGYWSLKILFYVQCGLFAAFSMMVVIKYL